MPHFQIYWEREKAKARAIERKRKPGMIELTTSCNRLTVCLFDWCIFHNAILKPLKRFFKSGCKFVLSQSISHFQSFKWIYRGCQEEAVSFLKVAAYALTYVIVPLGIISCMKINRNIGNTPCRSETAATLPLTKMCLWQIKLNICDP